MSDTNIAALRELLLENYGGLGRQLTRRLGSPDLVCDVLQETYLRLEGKNDLGEIRSPKAYLFRVALNIATDRRRAESRRLTTDEVDALLDLPDDRPDAARVIEDRSEVALLRRAIAELPARRRTVLLLSRIEGVPHGEIAARLGVTVRTVETDLKQAVEHCAERLQRPISAKFGSHRPKSSHVRRRAVGGQPQAAGDCGKALNRDQPHRPCHSFGSSEP